MILLIDNYDSFTYNLYQILAQLDDVKVVRNDKMTLEAIKGLKPTGIVLSPGPGRPENAGICIDVVKTFSGVVPILGVCLGHQAIAAAFGGNVVHAPSIVHGKSSVVFHSRQGLYENTSLPLEVGRYHSLTVEKSSLPKALKIDAESSDGVIMGIQHVTHPVFGVQFHPESIMSEDGPIMIKNFIDVCEKFQDTASQNNTSKEACLNNPEEKSLEI